MHTCCIARDCGRAFDPGIPETRTGLRSFWQRYCPACRTKGNAGTPTISNINLLRDSTQKQFLTDAQYWVEIRHQDYCSYCKDAVRPDCATAPDYASTRRVRVAQFIYFMEAIDYAQTLQRSGVQSWLRKPRFTQDGIESDYSHYNLKPLLATPAVLDGTPGEPAARRA